MNACRRKQCQHASRPPSTHCCLTVHFMEKCANIFFFGMRYHGLRQALTKCLEPGTMHNLLPLQVHRLSFVVGCSFRFPALTLISHLLYSNQLLLNFKCTKLTRGNNQSVNQVSKKVFMRRASASMTLKMQLKLLKHRQHSIC